MEINSLELSEKMKSIDLHKHEKMDTQRILAGNFSQVESPSVLKPIVVPDHRIVNLDVGGTFFKVSLATLEAYPTSYLCRLITEQFWHEDFVESKPIFIDRDASSFKIILNYYRYGISCLNGVNLNDNGIGTMLISDSQYYNLQEMCNSVGLCIVCNSVFWFQHPHGCKFGLHSNDFFNDVYYRSNNALQSIGVGHKNAQFLKICVATQSLKSVTNITLQYQATVDGFEAADFHRQCDGVERLLVIARSVRGYLFGGFSVEPFQSNGGVKPDKSSFLFSLINPKQIQPVVLTPIDGKIVGPDCDEDNGACYGCLDATDLCIHDSANENGGFSVLHNGGYHDSTGLGGTLFTGGARNDSDDDISNHIEKLVEIMAFCV